MRRPLNMTMRGREAARNTMQPPSPGAGWRTNPDVLAQGKILPGQSLTQRLTAAEAIRRFGKASRKEQL